jgi:hypothetical protein
VTVPGKGFISYAHEDFDKCEAFRKHLKASERAWKTEFWADQKIRAGYRWDDEVRQHINAADLFILLVSPEFFASDFIYETEIPAIESRCAATKGLIIPVVLRRCAWPRLTGELQAVPTEKGKVKPVDAWRRGSDGFDCARAQIDDAISDYYGEPLPSRPRRVRP